ncbi:hypothetical protein B0H16DRAFT_1482299 [Mycena metata]|uniref:Uncharacterized protein n=1 Tax=Mycena metata TaxID=1033252 RepID=A0AAD7GUU0_9AGAR|nr:hypothetical protein B0H16DRAFT_1482299 [Mycena metata]
MARSHPAPHATRNAGRQVQLSRTGRPGLSKAHKASQALRLAGPRKRRREFQEEIDEEFGRRATVLQRIATTHEKKLAYVHSILSRTTGCKATRVPSLHHALIHQRWLDAQADGRTTALTELKQSLKEDLESGEFDMESIDEKEKDRLLQQALNHRMNKRRGIRGTTKASQTDVTQSVMGVADTFDDLNFRTGTRAFAVFSRGNADDPTKPHIVDSGDSMSFLMEVYGISPIDFLRSFEGYCVTRDDGIHEKDDVDSVRKSVSKLLTNGLRRVKNSTTLTMEYVNYEMAICEGKGVELAGWPADVPLTRPATWNKETGRRIRDMLHSGGIHRVTMTRTQHAALIEENNAKHAALGAGALRQRAARSDKGVPRGPRKKKGKAAKEVAEEEEDEGSDGDQDVPPMPPQTRSIAPSATGTSIGASAQSHGVEYGAIQHQSTSLFPSLHYDPAPETVTAPAPLNLDRPDEPFFISASDLDDLNALMNDISSNGLFPEANTLGQQVFGSGSSAASFDFTTSWNNLRNGAASSSNNLPNGGASSAALPMSATQEPMLPLRVPTASSTQVQAVSVQVLAGSSGMNVGRQKRGRNGTEEEEDPDTPPKKQRKKRKDAGVSRKAGMGKATDDAPAPEAPVKTRKKHRDAGVPRRNKPTASSARNV